MTSKSLSTTLLALGASASRRPRTRFLPQQFAWPPLPPELLRQMEAESRQKTRELTRIGAFLTRQTRVRELLTGLRLVNGRILPRIPGLSSRQTGVLTRQRGYLTRTAGSLRQLTRVSRQNSGVPQRQTRQRELERPGLLPMTRSLRQIGRVLTRSARAGPALGLHEGHEGGVMSWNNAAALAYGLRCRV
jgi:hypothetical protein